MNLFLVPCILAYLTLSPFPELTNLSLNPLTMIYMKYHPTYYITIFLVDNPRNSTHFKKLINWNIKPIKRFDISPMDPRSCDPSPQEIDHITHSIVETSQKVSHTLTKPSTISSPLFSGGFSSPTRVLTPAATRRHQCKAGNRERIFPY